MLSHICWGPPTVTSEITNHSLENFRADKGIIKYSAGQQSLTRAQGEYSEKNKQETSTCRTYDVLSVFYICEYVLTICFLGRKSSAFTCVGLWCLWSSFFTPRGVLRSCFFFHFSKGPFQPGTSECYPSLAISPGRPRGFKPQWYFLVA